MPFGFCLDERSYWLFFAAAVEFFIERRNLCVIGLRLPTPIAFFEMMSVGGNC